MEKTKYHFLTTLSKTIGLLLAAGLVFIFILTLNGPALAVGPAAVVQAGSAGGLAGETVPVDIRVLNPSGMVSFQFDLEFDPAIAVPVEIVPGPEVQALSDNLVYNCGTPGQASFAWASAAGLTEDSVLCTVKFKINENAPARASTSLTISNLELSEDGISGIPAVPQNGGITVDFVPEPTQPGILAVSPGNGVAGSENQELTLAYTLGDDLEQGTVVFELAGGFGGADSGDTVSLPGTGTANLVADQIDGTSNQTVKITGVTAVSGRKVVLNLTGKTLPEAGTYVFSACADADGAVEDRSPSPGSGDEAGIFTIDPRLELEVQTVNTTEQEKTEVRGTTTSGAYVTVNEKGVAVDTGGRFSSEVGLSLGTNTITVRSTYGDQVRTVTRTVTREIELTVDEPLDRTVTVEQEIDVRGNVTKGASVKINGIPVQVNSDGSFTGKTGLAQGENQITIEASAPGLNPVPETRTVTRHWLDITGPADGLFTEEAQITVAGTTMPGASLAINGRAVTVASGGGFSRELSLASGQNNISVESEYEGRVLTAARTVTRGQLGLVVNTPAENIEIYAEKITVAGRTKPGASLTINGSAATVDPEGGFSREVALTPGANTITVQASYSGQTAAVTRTVERKLVFEIYEPVDNYTTDREKVVVRGKAQTGATVAINGTAVDLLAGGSFQAEAELEVGENLIFIEMNYLGETYTRTRTVTRNLTLSVTEPAEGLTTVYETVIVQGSTVPGASVEVDGAPAAVAADGSFAGAVSLATGENTVVVTAAHSGRRVTVSREVTRQVPDIEIISGDGLAGLPGSTLVKPLAVRVTGPGGNPITGVTVAFEALTAGGKLSAAPDTLGSGQVEVITDIQGRAAAFFTLGTSEGDYTVRARPFGISDAPAVTFTATTVLEPAVISVVQGDGQKAPAGKPVAQPVGVKVATGQGSPVPECAVEFTVTQGGGSVEPAAGGNYLTNAEGIAYAAWILGSAGGQVLSARVTGTAVPPAELAATAMEITTGRISPEVQEFKTATGRVEFIAKLTDENGVPVAGAAANWEITDGEGALIAYETLSDQNGIIKNILYPRSESVKVAVCPTGTSDDITFTAQAEGYPLEVTVDNYDSTKNTPLLGLAVNRETGKSIQAPVAQDGTFTMKLTGGSWEISLDYVPGLSTTPDWVLPSPQTVVMDGSRQITFVLEKAEYTIGGTVKDLNGNSVAGARVDLENPLNPGRGTFAVTGPDGSFTLNAPSGAYNLNLTAAGYQSFASRSLRVESGGRVILDGIPVTGALQLTLKKNQYSVQGKVTAKGSVVNGAAVYAYQESGATVQTETGSDGTYSLKLSPGSYHVRGWHKELGELILSPQNQKPFHKNPIDVSGNLTGIDLTLIPNRATVSGAVYIGDVLRPGIDLVFKNDFTGGLIQATTGTDGTYTKELPAGRGSYQVEVYLDHGPVATGELTLNVGDKKTLNFNLPAPCFVGGSVKLEGAGLPVPVPGAVVRARETEKGLNVTAVTNGDGTYKFKHLIPGEWRFPDGKFRCR